MKIKLLLQIIIAKWLYGYRTVSSTAIYAQAYHETGNFRSAIFKENKNLFGMKQAKKRKNFATGTNRGHATYKSHWDSIRDYFERQKNFKISDQEDSSYMVATVQSGYAEDPKYLTRWKDTANTIKLPFSPYLLPVLLFFLIILLISFFFKPSKKHAR